MECSHKKEEKKQDKAQEVKEARKKISLDLEPKLHRKARLSGHDLNRIRFVSYPFEKIRVCTELVVLL
jgi:hypothetical protein